MGRAVWCDTNQTGHAIDERTAIVVAGQTGTFFYCGPHSLDAVQKARVITGTEGKCALHYPPVGHLTITCDTPITPHTPATDQTATTAPPTIRH
jgi:hypothetical protein